LVAYPQHGGRRIPRAITPYWDKFDRVFLGVLTASAIIAIAALAYAVLDFFY
jgi:hypothetical protein